MTNILRRAILMVVIATLLCACSLNNKIQNDIHPDFITMLELSEKIRKGSNTDFLYIQTQGKNKATKKLSNLYSQVQEQLAQHDVTALYYFKDAQRHTASFTLDTSSWFTEAGVWSYQYSAGGYTEETKVDSVEQAIAQNTQSILHVCERANRADWFVCFNR